MQYRCEVVVEVGLDVRVRCSYQWQHQGGGHGGMGHLPPVRSSAPICPPPRQKEKMAKISYLRHFLWFLPPQIRILSPRWPPRKKFWCHHWQLLRQKQPLNAAAGDRVSWGYPYSYCTLTCSSHRCIAYIFAFETSIAGHRKLQYWNDFFFCQNVMV